ncbi:MAG: hypothetical protein WBW73_01875 [Rhodoplanes sp.]
MAIELHPKCKTRLIEVLTKGLPKIRAKNGMFIDRLSVISIVAVDSVLPESGRVREQLDYVDELPLTQFVVETLDMELWELDKFDGDRPLVNLFDIQGYSDATAVATRLLDSFQTLPWQYQLTFTLPDEIKMLLEPELYEFRLGPNIRLARPGKTFKERFPLDSGNARRNQDIEGSPLLFYDASKPPTWKVDALYLQVQVDGFVGQDGGSQTTVRAERLIRAFGGLGIALGLFVHRHKYIHGAARKTHYYVHRRNADGKWKPENRLEADDATDRGLRGLELSSPDGHLKTDAAKAAWVKARLQDLAVAFSSGPKAEPLLLAAQWLFDSYAGRDELLSFVQAMIVLEILLGDKNIAEEIGLGALLRNRLAYMIGSSYRDRTELLEDFSSIYRVRSQIVHTGKHRLSSEERRLFLKLRWMCLRVMAKELELLKGDHQ